MCDILIWVLCAPHTPQDPSNLQGKVQKHQAFEAELSANQSRVDALHKSGQELLDARHYALDEVSARMGEVSAMWKRLLEATELKGGLLFRRPSSENHWGVGIAVGPLFEVTSTLLVWE